MKEIIKPWTKIKLINWVDWWVDEARITKNGIRYNVWFDVNSYMIVDEWQIENKNNKKIGFAFKQEKKT